MTFSSDWLTWTPKDQGTSKNLSEKDAKFSKTSEKSTDITDNKAEEDDLMSVMSVGNEGISEKYTKENSGFFSQTSKSSTDITDNKIKEESLMSVSDKGISAKKVEVNHASFSDVPKSSTDTTDNKAKNGRNFSGIPKKSTDLTNNKAEDSNFTNNYIPRLPWQLENLIGAATCGDLGITHRDIPNVTSYVLSWAASYLLGDHEAIEGRLWEIYDLRQKKINKELQREWKGKR